MSTDKNNKTDWVMVPREPTEAMVEAGFQIGMQLAGSDWASLDIEAACYRAMIAAAPQPQPSRDRSDDAYALVKKIGRLTHTQDDGYCAPDFADDDDSREDLDGLIAQARDIMATVYPLEEPSLDREDLQAVYNAELADHLEGMAAFLLECTEGATGIYGSVQGDVTALNAGAAALRFSARDHDLTASGETLWQPIETAPKDRFVILYTPPDAEMNGFCAWAKWQTGSWYGVDDEGLTFNPLQAWDRVTHWMPLPSPPETPAKSPGCQND